MDNQRIANELLDMAESLKAWDLPSKPDKGFDKKVWKRGISDRISGINESIDKLLLVKKILTKASKVSISPGATPKDADAREGLKLIRDAHWKVERMSDLRPDLGINDFSDEAFGYWFST